MTFIIATVDTGNFEWTALGRTKRECRAALIRAYADHAQATPGADAELMVDLIMASEINYSEIEMGEALRDGSKVPPA